MIDIVLDMVLYIENILLKNENSNPPIKVTENMIYFLLKLKNRRSSNQLCTANRNFFIQDHISFFGSDKIIIWGNRFVNFEIIINKYTVNKKSI